MIDRPEDLTAEWLTDALRVSRPDARVHAVGREPIGTGQTGASFRLHLEGEGGIPATLVAKVAAGDRAARERVAAGYRNEIGFYTVFQDRVRVRTPRCWHAEISADHCSFVLLLDDLAPARPGVQAEGCRVEQAADAVRNLAGLHAPTWNDPTLVDHREWLTAMTGDRAAFLSELLVGATEEFVARYADDLTHHDVETLRSSAARTARWGAIDTGVITLVHGDYRLDNLMFPPVGDGVIALDWQTLSVAPPGRDLGYFLATSLLVDDRRAHERALVQTYVDALGALGVDHSFDAAFDAYRLGVLQGPMITIIGCMYATAERSARADAMFLAMATRSCAALRELDSFALVEA